MQNPLEACYAELAIGSRASEQGQAGPVLQLTPAPQTAAIVPSLPAKPTARARSQPAAGVSSQFEAAKAARKQAAEAAAKAAQERATAAAAKLAHEQAAAAAAKAAAELLQEEEQAQQAAQRAKQRSSVKKARQKLRKQVGTCSAAAGKYPWLSRPRLHSRPVLYLCWAPQQLLQTSCCMCAAVVEHTQQILDRIHSTATRLHGSSLHAARQRRCDLSRCTAAFVQLVLHTCNKLQCATTAQPAIR